MPDLAPELTVSGPRRLVVAGAGWEWLASRSHIRFNNLPLAKNPLPAIILGFVSRDTVGESAVQVDVLCQAVRYRAFVSRLCGVSSLLVERGNFGSRFCWRGSPHAATPPSS